ncbi:MAG: phosphate ABC transporter permease subunit PstC [Eubacteriales bacterium]|nr:phosphate ABC transporter permease subunit PstC [Eubacteriales bacterium]
MDPTTTKTKQKGGLNKLLEQVMHGVFLVSALASILAVALICVFLFAGGVPAMREIGVLDFLTGTSWRPGNDIYGILPMIVGSIYITAGAIVIGVPIGLLTAIFMAFYCPKRLYGVLKPCTELLAGIPSIVYGFFGMVVIVPMIREVAALAGVDISGSSILAASILLGIMILPTIIGVSEAALRAVPRAFYEGAVAMGATHERAVFSVMMPAAKSGVLASIVLGIGRAIGETMAVILVAGNQPRLTGDILKGIRTMTANIVIEMGYATGLHREALIATGVVLFVFILLINLTFSVLKRRKDT